MVFFGKAIALDPFYAKAHYNCGSLFFQLENWRKQLLTLEKQFHRPPIITKLNIIYIRP